MRAVEHGMSVKKACEALGASRGGCYAILNRPKSSRQIAREALEPFVEDTFYANNRRYGSRRIVVELRKISIVANGKTVQRMMTRKGLVSCRAPRSTEGAEGPRTKGWIGYTYLDDSGRIMPAFLNSTGVMYPSVE